MDSVHIPIAPEVVCLGLDDGAILDGAALVEPIAQSTTFCRDGVGSKAEHQYSRVSNPTVARLERVLGRLENAPPSASFSTGLAAESALLLACVRGGEHVVCSRAVYGGTTRLLQRVLSQFGVQATFVDSRDPCAIADAVRSDTRLVFVETPANPTLDLTDIRKAASIAHAGGAILAVDNTFLTPILQQPLDLGADVSVYSTTKFVDGHSVAMGGALVSRDETLLERIRFIRKCTGAIQTPFNAWLTLNGLKTLPLRIRRQSQTAAKLARWLARRSEVVAVHYPSLLNDAQRAVAEAQHVGAHGAVLSFEVAGGVEAGDAFVRGLRRLRLVEHVGSVETLVTHPATMTHADVPVEQRAEVGVGDGLLRLSVGLEPHHVIREDLERGLLAASRHTERTSARSEGAACPASA